MFFFITHLIVLFSFILQYVFVYLINYIVFIGNEIFMLKKKKKKKKKKKSYLSFNRGEDFF